MTSVYFVRSRTYYKYFKNLLEELEKYLEKNNEESSRIFLKREISKDFKDLYLTGLKALWSLSQIYPKKDTPLEEIEKTVFSFLSEEERKMLQEIKRNIFENSGNKVKEEELLGKFKKFKKILERNLKDIL